MRKEEHAHRKEEHAHRSIDFRCPFFNWDSATGSHGECGNVQFGCKDTATEYMVTYCAGRWEQCPVAKALLKSYDLKEKNNGI